MTALTIVQTAAAWLGLPVPEALFSSTEPQIIELRTLLNEEIGELKKWPDCYWRKLIRENTFTSVAASVQTDPNVLPDDLEYIIPNSMWDRTISRPCLGPIDPQVWQAWEARPVLTSILWGWRLRGNDFLTAPDPPAGDTVAYEYISNLAVYASGDTVPTQTYFEADSDTSVFDELMVSRGVRWRYLSQKKLDYTQEYQTWVYLVQREASRNKGMPVLNAACPPTAIIGPYVPSFSWPGP